MLVTEYEGFEYDPPAPARTAKRVLIKPNLGYPFDPPVTVSMPLLQRVIRGIRQVNPGAEILIVEGVCHPMSITRIMARLGLPDLLRDGVSFLDADKLECKLYGRFWAPALLDEVECRISVGAFKRTEIDGRLLISASIKNLFGLLPRARYAARTPHSRGKLHVPDVHVKIQQVYEDIGKRFDGAVVDLGRKLVNDDWRPDRGKQTEIGKVVWGTGLVMVDSLACAVAEEPEPDYLKLIKGEPIAKPASAKPAKGSRGRPSRGWASGPAARKVAPRKTALKKKAPPRAPRPDSDRA